MDKKKRKSKQKKLISVDDAANKVVLITEFISAVVILTGFLVMAIWPLYVVNRSARVTAVVKERTEPRRHSSYNADKSRTDVSYTSDLTVLYQDPDTEERTTGTLMATYSTKSGIPEVGQEISILIQDGKVGPHLSIAWSKWVYYWASFMGAAGFVAVLVIMIKNKFYN